MAVKLAGRYEVLQEVAGQGAVHLYRVRDTVDGTLLLIKALAVDSESMEEFIEFQEDAALVTTLDHPNIWKAFGTFIDEGMSCIVLEVVDGLSLNQVLRAGRLPLDRVRSIALQIASALAYSHRRGIIHRDIEPENIFIAAGDHVKLRATAKVGAARVMKGAAIPAVPTGPRSALYASPEQREGRTVDARTDIYSLGAVTYHMVTGHAPDDEVIDRAGLEFPPDVPDEWQRLIARAMAKNERFRFASAAEMGEAAAMLPVPGAPPARFHVPAVTKRCPSCGREGKGRYCGNCGTALGEG